MSEWAQIRPNRQLPRACSCPGRCPPNAGRSLAGATQPSCVAPNEKTPRSPPKLVVLGRPARCAGYRWGLIGPRHGVAADSRGERWTDGWAPERRDLAPTCLRGRGTGKRAAHGPSPPRGHADRRPTHPSRLHHRARRRLSDSSRDGYAVFWRTSGRDLCTVERRSPSARCAARARSCASAPGRARCAAAPTTGRCGGRAGSRGHRRATSTAASRSCRSSSAGRPRLAHGAGARPALGPASARASAAAAARRAAGTRRPRATASARWPARACSACTARGAEKPHMIAVIAGGDEDRGPTSASR